MPYTIENSPKTDLIVIAAEVYSDNMGDAAIYQSLRFLLQHLNPNLDVIPLDMSGRSASSSLQQSQRKSASAAKIGEQYLGFFFAPINGVAQWALNRKRRTQQWLPLLENAHALVIGGGQLLMDNDLGFPVKIFGLQQTARQLGVPVHISACGVSSRWSMTARLLFKDTLRHTRSITLRDHLSQTRLAGHLPAVVSQVTFDPAIWASEVYGIETEKPKTLKIGINVIHPHDTRHQTKDTNRILSRWMELIKIISARGIDFELFTTGSRLDDRFAHTLGEACRMQFEKNCLIAARPNTPEILVKTLQRYKGIVATRLHASILSNSYQIPSVGLAWDEKVKAYYQDTGQKDRLFLFNQFEPLTVLNTCLKAIEDDMPGFDLQACKERALQNAKVILQEN